MLGRDAGLSATLRLNEQGRVSEGSSPCAGGGRRGGAQGASAFGVSWSQWSLEPQVPWRNCSFSGSNSLASPAWVLASGLSMSAPSCPPLWMRNRLR